MKARKIRRLSCVFNVHNVPLEGRYNMNLLAAAGGSRTKPVDILPH